MYLWIRLKPMWAGKVCNLQMSSRAKLSQPCVGYKISVLTSNLVSVMPVEIKCPRGQVGLCRPRQRKEKLFLWRREPVRATSVERKYPCRQVCL